MNWRERIKEAAKGMDLDGQLQKAFPTNKWRLSSLVPSIPSNPSIVGFFADLVMSAKEGDHKAYRLTGIDGWEDGWYQNLTSHYAIGQNDIDEKMTTRDIQAMIQRRFDECLKSMRAVHLSEIDEEFKSWA